MKKKVRIDRAQRKLYLAHVDACGVILYSLFSAYDRAMRWYGKEGLTPAEQQYAEKRRQQMNQVADDMSALTQRLRRTTR